MGWTKVNFGKYGGKTLPQIVLKDPDWFFWAISKDVFKGSLQIEAKEVNRKARSILIPKNDSGDMEVEYVLHPSTKKFSGLEIVPESQALHEGSSFATRKKVVDMGFARDFASYDKLGGGILIDEIKRHIFGDVNYRLTKKRCEDFFSDDSNFATT